MKTYMSFRIFLILFLFVLFIGYIFAQDNFWQSSNGPFGSNLTNSAKILTTENGNIILSDYGFGIFMTIDDGETWAKISHSLPTQFISAMAIDSAEVLWVGTNIGIFKSINYGRTWSHNLTGDSIRFVEEISIDLNGYVFAGIFESGIIRSTDNGTTWVELNTLPIATYKTTLITRSNVILTSPLGGNGVFRSSDTGDTWEKVGFEDSTQSALSFVELPDGEILSFTYGTGLQRSTNNGLSWQQTNAVIPDPEWMTFKKMLIDKKGNIYGGGSGLAKSTDNGVTWERCILPNDLTYISVVSLASSQNLGILCGTSKGILYSTNYGETWTLSKFTYGSITNLIANFQNDIFVKSTYGSFKSTNFGDSWINISLCPDFIEDNGNFLSHSDGEILRSTDQGKTWQSLYSLDEITSPVVSNSKGTIFASGIQYSRPGYPELYFSGLVRSTDNGQHWEIVKKNFTPSVIYVNSSIFFAAVDTTLYKTTDYENWINSSNGISGTINYITSSKTNQMFIGTTEGLYTSTNDGESWNLLSPDLENITSIAINNEEVLYVISNKENTYKSNDMGVQWLPVQSGLPSSEMLSLVASPNGYLYVGTSNHGVYRSKEVTTYVFDDKDNKVINFQLSQNYPNPFNPITKISFSVPHTEFISLKIYDLLGNEVETLISNQLSAGYYSQYWDASNYSSGIYFCRLFSNTFCKTIKLLLLK